MLGVREKGTSLIVTYVEYITHSRFSFTCHEWLGKLLQLYEEHDFANVRQSVATTGLHAYMIDTYFAVLEIEKLH